MGEDSAGVVVQEVSRTALGCTRCPVWLETEVQEAVYGSYGA